MGRAFRSVRSVGKRRAGGRNRFKGIFIGSCILAPVVAFVWLHLPLYRTHAMITIHGLVAEELSEAVEEHLAETDTSKWIVNRQGAMGVGTSYLDLPDVSRFQRDVALEADTRLSTLSMRPVRLPASALAGLPIWVERGPAVPVWFRLQGPVRVKLDVSDHAAGTSSSHAVELNLSARVHLLGPFLNRSILVQESTPIVYFLVSSR